MTISIAAITFVPYFIVNFNDDQSRMFSSYLIRQGVLHHVCFFSTNRIGFICRNTSMMFLYEKCLRISKQAMARVSTGHITNIISSDCVRCNNGISSIYIN